MNQTTYLPARLLVSVGLLLLLSSCESPSTDASMDPLPDASMDTKTEGETLTADVDPVIESKDWSAWEDHQPPGPISFYVKGTIVVRATNYAARLVTKVPQGINPKILLLDLFVEKTGPIGGDAITELEARYSEESDYKTGTYTEVTILSQGSGGAHIPKVDIIN